MHFLLALYGDQSTWGKQTEAEHATEMSAFAAFEREARQAGVLVANHALEPADRAAAVRRDGSGEPALADGPIDDATEQLGAVYVLECRDRDEAARWAAKVPLVGAGGFSAIEIRPVLGAS
jgi:hypothetical protein